MKKQYFAMIMFIAIAVASMTACGVHTEAAAEETEKVTSESIPEQTTVVGTVPVSLQETPVPTQTEAEESSAEKEQSLSAEEEELLSAEEVPAAYTSPNTLEGGANIEDAVSLPIAFKAYGTVRDRVEAWYTFTTGDGSTEYRITTINKSPDSGAVMVYLFDETGAQLACNGAEIDGAASTIVSNTLTPNTKYYLMFQRFKNDTGKNTYVTYVSTPDQKVTSELLPVTDDVNIDNPANNQDDAALLSLASKKYGIVENASNYWYAFTTGEENTEYKITTINKSLTAGAVMTFLYDEYGNMIAQKGAEIDGVAATIDAKSLTPNTTYYLRIQRFLPSSGRNNYVLFFSTVDQHVVSVLKSTDGETNIINNGSNQDDAVLLPLNSKRYGVTKDASNLWFAFTTGEENTEYKITTINKSLTAGAVMTFLYDEYGNMITQKGAEIDGVAATIDAKSLTPNTTYYLRVRRFQSDTGTNDFMVIIRDSMPMQEGSKTAGNLSEARGTSDMLESVLHPGTNQDEPAYILYGYKVSSKVSNKVGEWYAFTTESASDASYTITTIDETPEGGAVLTFLYDEYGNMIAQKGAEIDGVPSEIKPQTLTPNTTYYIRVVRFQSDAGTNNYSLFVDVSVPSEEHVAIVEKIEEEPLVFEVPFELNETQVHFVANEAIFIDEEAAIAALAPVAEIILAHPDHPILLAGTTATWGSQDSCVNLSNRRAGAVKDLLVNYYGVPEDQLKTIGLGFAADPFVRGQDVDSNGNFIETEGAKNRRTIIMDAEDPIAKELLGE